jgi:hypothetical protein
VTNVDDPGHEPATPTPMRGLHHRLVEADHRANADPFRIVHEW